MRVRTAAATADPPFGCTIPSSLRICPTSCDRPGGRMCCCRHDSWLFSLLLSRHQRKATAERQPGADHRQQHVHTSELGEGTEFSRRNGGKIQQKINAQHANQSSRDPVHLIADQLQHPNPDNRETTKKKNVLRYLKDRAAPCH